MATPSPIRILLLSNTILIDTMNIRLEIDLMVFFPVESFRDLIKSYLGHAREICRINMKYRNNYDS